MIIIGDVHGNFDTLIALLDMIPQEEKDKGVAIVGDLVDRGPKSKQVIQYCMDNNVHVVMGNHELMMLDDYPRTLSHIANNGHVPFTNPDLYHTYLSYETVLEDELDDRGLPTRVFELDTLLEHMEWVKKLPLFLEFPDVVNDEGRMLVISHSNVGNVWSMKDSISLKERERFQDEVLRGRPTKIKDVPDIYNVIGHTIQDDGPRIRKTYANVDTGCFWTRDACNRRLTALQFPEMIIYEHENIDNGRTDSPFKNILTVEELKDRKKKIRKKRY